LDDITFIVATGYGRINVPFADRHFTELTCHARGSRIFPVVRWLLNRWSGLQGLQIRL
jgi:activator of 2-hydroxyglutaryl-CoA dehydratase